MMTEVDEALAYLGHQLEDVPVNTENFREVIWEGMNGKKPKDIKEDHSYSYNIQRKYRNTLKEFGPSTRHMILQAILTIEGEHSGF